jgi:hypothetical protein
VAKLLRWWVLLAGVAAAGVSAALTRPFTGPGEVVTAMGLASLVAVVLVQHLGAQTPRVLVRRARDPAGVPAIPWRSRWVIWIAPVAAVVSWELFCYLQSPRAAHPTLSSMLDTVTATQAGRGAAFAAWLVLGWYLVTR